MELGESNTKEQIGAVGGVLTQISLAVLDLLAPVLIGEVKVSQMDTSLQENGKHSAGRGRGVVGTQLSEGQRT